MSERRKREFSYHASAVVAPMEDDNSLEWDVASGNGEEQIHFRNLINTVPIEFMDGFDMKISRNIE